MNNLEQHDQSTSNVRKDEGNQEDYPVKDKFVQEEEIFECLKCKNTFKTKSEQIEHALTHSDSEHFESQECGEFTHMSNLSRHAHSEDTHTEKTHCECTKCGRIFSWESNISKHILIHTGDVNWNSQETCATESNMTDCDEQTSFSCEELSEENLENKKNSEVGCASSCEVKMEPSEIENNMSDFDNQDTSTSIGDYSEGNQKNRFTEETQFDCQDCGKVFSMKHSSAKHAYTHLGVRKYQCQKCAKKFTGKSHFAQRDAAYTGIRNFECEECGKPFSQKANLITHMLIHSGVRNYECMHCDMKFIQKSHLLEHMLIHGDNKTYECKLCSKSFTQKSTFNSHCRSHHRKKDYECTECGRKFSRKLNLERHINQDSCARKGNSPSHPDSDSAAGEDAGLSNNVNHLEQQDQSASSVMKAEEDHPVTDISAHKQQENLECPGCGITFNNKSELVDHALKQCDIGNFQCPVCAKKFTHKSNLTRHLMIHTGVKNHECAECGKKFYQKGNLKQHILTHRGECNYVCKSCGKTFFLLSSLVKHSHIHNVIRNESQESVEVSDNSEVNCVVNSSDVAMEDATLDSNVSGSDLQEKSASFVSQSVGDKENHLVTDTSIHDEAIKYECSNCGECFVTKSKLVAHTIKHSSARVFECQECGKIFSYKSNLTRHLLLHSGVKNYECEQCGKRFNQKGNLNQHLLTHRGDKNYVCQRCGEKFYLKCSLIQHRCTQTNAWNDEYQDSPKLTINQHDNFGVNSTSQSKDDANSNVAAYIIVDEPKRDDKVRSLDLQEQSGSNVPQPVSDEMNDLVMGTSAYKEEKRHECHECGKKFTFRSNLTRHAMIHSGIRRYACEECGKTFNQKGNLNQHMILHQDLETYPCEGCGQRFNLKCALNKHICVVQT